MIIENDIYYIDLINSSKAYQFTAYYHYSGTGFKKSKINQGVFRKSDNKLVGVLQWGCSAQEGIRLDRYVKEPITTENYLELNRFCMADSEPKNAESQAISLGVKWIKKNRKDIKLLVSYAGRKEGNYGYIYQATNWEYLGYFISDGFWMLDGNERHQITVWYHYNKYGDKTKGFKQGICDLYHDVRQTWSKQFIYIQRLDKKLTPASEILDYPKIDTDYPIITRVEQYKSDEDFMNNRVIEIRKEPDYYHIIGEPLFGKPALIRQGNYQPVERRLIDIYDIEGQYLDSCESLQEAGEYCGISLGRVRTALNSGKLCDDYFFRSHLSNESYAVEIDVPYICIIDGIYFFKQADVVDYCGVSKQAVSYSKKTHGHTICGKPVIWNDKVVENN